MNISNLKHYNTFILISKERKCSFSFALFISFLMFFIFNIVHFIMTGAITYLQQKYAHTWHRLDMRKNTQKWRLVWKIRFFTRKICALHKLEMRWEAAQEWRIIMKIFFYALREYDEKKYVEKFAEQYSFEYGFHQIILQCIM